MRIDRIAEAYPDLLTACGYDDCILGVTDKGEHTVAVYSVTKILDVLMSRDDMDSTEAREFFDFNIIGAYKGPKTPIYVEDEICQII